MAFGLLVGAVGFALLMVKTKIAPFPQGINLRKLFGLAILATIGFTMSLFFTSLALSNSDYVVQAKIRIFFVFIIGGIIGIMML